MNMICWKITFYYSPRHDLCVASQSQYMYIVIVFKRTLAFDMMDVQKQSYFIIYSRVENALPDYCSIDLTKRVVAIWSLQ